MKLLRTITFAILAASFTAPVSSQVTLNFDACQRGPALSPLQYGIFYEEINNAGDGGLYAELIRNRCFEDSSNPDYWSIIGDASMSITRSGLMNENRSAALLLSLHGKDSGVSNTGYWGIKSAYGDMTLTLWIKSDKGYKGKITAGLSEDYPRHCADMEVDLNSKWQKIVIPLPDPKTEDILENARFNLTFSNPGEVTIGMVSLFPKTYKDRENGCRRDLAEMLEALHPKFVRFPGGCYIEGDGTLEGQRRFEWKKTIGPIEERPGHFNANWGYPSTDGLGFHEFLQLTEDLGAEPLFVVNVGIGHGWIKDFTDIDEFIEEALDALEYCNGDINTFWGAQRAANGHPEPFNMHLIEIGNENYNFDDERSDHYAERYKAFYDAIKAKYPEVTLIGNVEAWGTDNPSWRNSYPVEIVDEHYYRTPKWFENNYNKYDSYPRSGAKVYVGEYAVTEGYGKNGNLRAALGEAVYMQGLENNSDICVMASYAPIFFNEEREVGWIPDMIRFNHNACFGTPSYYVQKLMPQYLGTQNIKWTEENNLKNAEDKKIGVSSWSTTVAYDNVKVIDGEGNVIIFDDFSGDATDWMLPSSYWSVSEGQLRQASSSEQGKLALCNTLLPDCYTLELDATKLSGAEGFLIAVNASDANNYTWWNIGGWNNTQNGLQLSKNNTKTDIDLKPGKIETGRTYHIKMEVNGSKIKCWLDDQLIHDVTLPSERKIYVSSSIDEEESLMYLKLVNTGSENVAVNLNIRNAEFDGCENIVLTSSDDLDENSIDNPFMVCPAECNSPVLIGNSGEYIAPSYSLSILSIRLKDVSSQGSERQVATEQQMSELKEELSSVISKLGWLHDSTSLPVMTDSGVELKWTAGKGVTAFDVSSNRHSASLHIIEANNSGKDIEAGTVGVWATLPEMTDGYLEIPVILAPCDEWYGYLYAYMNSGKEITNFALGNKEGAGKRFEELLNGDEIFDTSSLAGIEGGTRDAYIGRGIYDREYFMLTTDMCVAKSGEWINHGIDLLRSNDLVHWESTVFDFRKGKIIFSDSNVTTDCFKTDEEYAKINRVWAPQFIPDFSVNDGVVYLVYYSILSDNEGDNYDKIYYSYADSDFKTLTQPRLLFDAGVSLIDADIVYNNYDRLFHMLVKRTGSDSTTTGIYEYTSPVLVNGDWKEIGRIDGQNTTGVEAPTQIRRIGEDIWNMYFMRFDEDYSFKVADMPHDGGNAGLPVKLAGTGSFQHGSVIYVDKEEYDMLHLWSDVMGLLSQAKTAKESSSTIAFDKAIELTENILTSNRSVESLLAALPEAYEILVKANGQYLAEGERLDDGFIDITHLLKNSRFDGNEGSGWSGTPFTAVSNGTAEHFSRVFDTYQVLAAMPAGAYRLEAQGFYRYGLPATALPAHNDGSERLLASLYINEEETPFMSLYDEEYSTYPNNMYQAYVAFNTDCKYKDNSVEVILTDSGSLRCGVRKLQMVDGDWTIFDNFRLLYNPDPDAVEAIDMESRKPVDVYSSDGILLKKNVDPHNATSGLSEGLYIIGGRKVIIK